MQLRNPPSLPSNSPSAPLLNAGSAAAAHCPYRPIQDTAARGLVAVTRQRSTDEESWKPGGIRSVVTSESPVSNTVNLISQQSATPPAEEPVVSKLPRGSGNINMPSGVPTDESIQALANLLVMSEGRAGAEGDDVIVDDTSGGAAVNPRSRKLKPLEVGGLNSSKSFLTHTPPHHRTATSYGSAKRFWSHREGGGGAGGAGVGRYVDRHVYLNTRVVDGLPDSPPIHTTEAAFVPIPATHGRSPRPAAVTPVPAASSSSGKAAVAPTDACSAIPSPCRITRSESMPVATDGGGGRSFSTQQLHLSRPKVCEASPSPSVRVRRMHTTTNATWRGLVPPAAESTTAALSASITSSPQLFNTVAKRSSMSLPAVGASAHLRRSIDSIQDAIAAVRMSSPPSTQGWHDAASSGQQGSGDADVGAGVPGISLFSLFGMLERESKFDDFGRLYEVCKDSLASFLEKVSSILYKGNPDAARAHCQLMYLLEHPEARNRVGAEFFSDPVNAWPLHMLCLVCCFQTTARRCGYEALHNAMKSGGLMAVGKGLFAALAVAMSANEEELVHNTAKLYTAAFYVGILMRRQQHELETGLQMATRRNFALLLVNIPIYTLRQLVEEVNRGVNCTMGAGAAIYSEGTGRGMPASPVSDGSTAGSYPPPNFPHSELEVSRVISNRSAIVCGHPLDLLRLDMVLTRYADFNGVKIHKDYLPAMAPENSSYYNRDMLFSLMSYWDELGVTLDPADLKVRVYSPVDGEVWESNTGLSARQFATRVAEAVTWRNQDLTYTLQHLHDGDALLDFSANALPIGPLIAWMNKQITILAAPANSKHTSALPPPRRSPQDFAVRGTLHKLAIVNRIVRVVHRQLQRTPHTGEEDAPVELSTTFGTLGFLRYIHTAAEECADGTHANVKRNHGGGSAVSSPRGLPLLTPPDESTAPSRDSSEDHRPLSRESARGADAPCGLMNRSPFLGESFTDGGGISSCPPPLPGVSHTANMSGPAANGGYRVPSMNASGAIPLRSATHGTPPMMLAHSNASITADQAVMMPRGGCGEGTGAVATGSGILAVADHSGGLLPVYVVPPADPPLGAIPPQKAADTSSRAGARNEFFFVEHGSPPTSLLNICSLDGTAPPPPPLPPPESVSHPYLLNEEYVVHRNVHFEGVINVYQVSQMIKYYEMQFGCVLREGAVLFASLLCDYTGIAFPPYTLLLCPTVFALLELWDGYEFIAQWCAPQGRR